MSPYDENWMNQLLEQLEEEVREKTVREATMRRSLGLEPRREQKEEPRA